MAKSALSTNCKNRRTDSCASEFGPITIGPTPYTECIGVINYPTPWLVFFGAAQLRLWKKSCRRPFLAQAEERISAPSASMCAAWGRSRGQKIFAKKFPGGGAPGVSHAKTPMQIAGERCEPRTPYFRPRWGRRPSSLRLKGGLVRFLVCPPGGAKNFFRAKMGGTVLEVLEYRGTSGWGFRTQDWSGQCCWLIGENRPKAFPCGGSQSGKFFFEEIRALVICSVLRLRT